jgi:phage tail-like protein
MAAPKLTQKFVVKEAAEKDPAPAYKFWVEMESKVVAEFKECGGLRVERKVQTYKEGGVNHYLHKLPGQIEYSNITLKYGVLEDQSLWNWFQQGLLEGKVDRINFSILLRDVSGEVVRRWNVVDAFPVKWEGPQLNSEGNQTSIETLEVAHHGLKLGE